MMAPIPKPVGTTRALIVGPSSAGPAARGTPP